MRKIIIFGIVFLMMFTLVSADNFRRVGELEDNDILNINEDRINDRLDIVYEGSSTIDETIIFYFNMNDFRRDEVEGEFINFEIRKRFGTSLDIEILNSCLAENNNDYCYNTFIDNNNTVIIENGEEEIEIAPIKKQLIEEVNAIKNKVRIYKIEIRRNRNPIVNFIEGLNLGNILG